MLKLGMCRHTNKKLDLRDIKCPTSFIKAKLFFEEAIEDGEGFTLIFNYFDAKKSIASLKNIDSLRVLNVNKHESVVQVLAIKDS